MALSGPAQQALANALNPFGSAIPTNGPVGEIIATLGGGFSGTVTAPLFVGHVTGPLSTPFTADLTPGGSSAITATEIWTWTPPTSSTATLSALGQTLTITFNTSATQTVTDAKAAVAANPIFAAFYATSGTTTLVLTSNAPGVSGAAFPVSTNGAHGSSIVHTSTGAGQNAIITTTSGRVVFSANQFLYTISNSLVTSTSIILPIVETGGVNLSLGVTPFAGGFVLISASSQPQFQASFVVFNPNL